MKKDKKLEEFSKYQVDYKKHVPIFIDNMLRLKTNYLSDNLYFAYETPNYYIFKKNIEDTTFVRIKKTNITNILLIKSAYDNTIFKLI